MTNNTPKSNKNITAITVTVAICIILAAAAVLFSILNPEDSFDFIPSIISPQKVHYSDMEYVRPDNTVIIENMDEIMLMIDEGVSFTEQSRLFTELNENLINFRTMLTLAEIRYYTDVTDDYYKEENELLQLEYVGIYDKTAELLDKIAESAFKSNYERSFFGIGYFNDWEPMSRTEAASALLEREQELITEYQDIIANTFVTYEGRDIYLPSEEYYSLAPEVQAELIDLYTEKYNAELGEIYVELIKLRQDLAKEEDTDYTSIAYGDLGRDYTPEEADAYIESITKVLLPKIKTYEVDLSLYDIPTDTVTSFYHLSLAASKMGGNVEKAFDYMVKYGLYEVAVSDSKQGMSFEVLLEKYYAPFMFVSSTGTANDLLTYAHEFGHFADDYITLGMSRTVDSAEIASQAMAYIVPFYSDGMGNVSGDEFLKINLYSTLEMYVSAIFVHEFETAVYALPAEEITLEKLNSIAKNVALSLGLNENAAESFSESWFEYQHIYIAPLYYSAYTISNDAALQVLEAELENPLEGGIEAYLDIIDRDPSKTFVENIEAAGFESPFAEGRAEKIAELIDSIFFPNEVEKVEETTVESIPNAA